MNVGVVFVDDLNTFARWHDARGRDWSARRGAPGALLPPTVHPPPGVVLVVRPVMWDRMVDSAGWLSLARRVAVVVDASAEPEVVHDADLAELTAMEHEDFGEALDCPLHIETIVAAEQLDGAIERALARVRGDGDWARWQIAPPAEAMPPGPWIPWSAPIWHHEYGPDLRHCRTHMAAQLCRRSGRPTLLDSIGGRRIDLLTGAESPTAELVDVGNAWHGVAARPERAGWLQHHPRKGGGWGRAWSLTGDGPGRKQGGGFGRPIGIDPTEQVAWSGGRCRFDWRVITDRGPAWWTFSDHDWPAGHGKKLYGYEDNDPQWVHLSPDARACLSVYDHDALVVPGLPLRWRRVGDIAVAERAQGEPRALLFVREGRDDSFPADPATADEDARDRAPTVTLGPDSKRRYVVGFDDPVWRVVGEGAVRLDAAGAGWVVYDAAHRLVHRGVGRLLGGWHRWVVVLDRGQLARHDLVDGTVEPLGPADGEITTAVALPGTPNVLLLDVGDQAARIRLV